MNAQDAVARFTELFHEAYLRFHARLAPGEQRLSPESLGVLAHLATTGPLSIAEACGHFERSQAAMSDIVTRLERRGLLARVADKRDRRRTLVWMTSAGRQALARSTRVLDPTLLVRAFEHRTEEEREQFLRLFEQLLQPLNRGDGR